MHLRKCYERVTNSFVNFLYTLRNSLVYRMFFVILSQFFRKLFVRQLISWHLKDIRKNYDRNTNAHFTKFCKLGPSIILVEYVNVTSRICGVVVDRVSVLSWRTNSPRLGCWCRNDSLARTTLRLSNSSATALTGTPARRLIKSASFCGRGLVAGENRRIKLIRGQFYRLQLCTISASFTNTQQQNGNCRNDTCIISFSASNERK